jgi:hypothetical protein
VTHAPASSHASSSFRVAARSRRMLSNGAPCIKMADGQMAQTDVCVSVCLASWMMQAVAGSAQPLHAGRRMDRQEDGQMDDGQTCRH